MYKQAIVVLKNMVLVKFDPILKFFLFRYVIFIEFGIYEFKLQVRLQSMLFSINFISIY